jgi:hypothetical protein
MRYLPFAVVTASLRCARLIPQTDARLARIGDDWPMRSPSRRSLQRFADLAIPWGVGMPEGDAGLGNVDLLPPGSQWR